MTRRNLFRTLLGAMVGLLAPWSKAIASPRWLTFTLTEDMEAGGTALARCNPMWRATSRAVEVVCCWTDTCDEPLTYSVPYLVVERSDDGGKSWYEIPHQGFPLPERVA